MHTLAIYKLTHLMYPTRLVLGIIVLGNLFFSDTIPPTMNNTHILPEGPKGHNLLSTHSFADRKQESNPAQTITIAREVRVIKNEEMQLTALGTIMLGELSDCVYILPKKDLCGTFNKTQFTSDLLSVAGRKPYIIVDLNPINSLSSDYIIYPLLDLLNGCKTNSSKVVLVSSDETVRAKVKVAFGTKNSKLAITESPLDALRLVDFDQMQNNSNLPKF